MVPPEGAPLPVLGTPLVRRAGGDVTILALAGTVAKALAAADVLAGEGIECEVIDLRGLVPLDDEPPVASLRRTGRLLVVEEEPAQGGWTGALVTRLVQSAWASLHAAPRVVSAPNVPIPYGPVLEKAYQPSVEAIAAAARDLFGTGR
jgi:pyruvate/2-oxoglutarate/acetoin dehydrogenase E1 component